MEFIQVELINLLTAVAVACVGWLTKHGVTFLKNKGIVAKLESEKEIVKIVVSAVEQLYAEVNGTEKLRLARKEIVKLANQKGIKIKEADIDLLIESSVKEMKKEIEDISEKYGLKFPASVPIWQLSVGEQQRVEIVKTLYRGADIIIFDEPTSVTPGGKWSSCLGGCGN